MDTNQLLIQLRALANRWAMKAREFAQDGRNSADQAQAQYYRGFAEGYYKAAMELAAVLKGDQTDTAPSDGKSAVPRSPSLGGETPSAKPAPAAPIYATLSIGDVISMLEYVGAGPRDVIAKPGNIYHAIFSRWQSLTEPERIAKISGADPRLVILNFGKLKDTNDPYVEFAFKQG
ncbi:MAG: hypothetical protein U0670_20690 [Anaerolineae bacterium]